jgi:hypothetical protein
MCSLHFQSATCRGKAEKLVGTLAPIIAMVGGLFSTIMLLVQWQGKVLLNLFTAGMLGIVIFLALWAVISIVLAPLFATSAAKKARHAVRMRRYWYQDQFVRLEFQNEQLAETVLFGK